MERALNMRPVGVRLAVLNRPRDRAIFFELSARAQ